MHYLLQAFIRGSIPFVIMSGISGIMKIQNMDAFQIKSTFLTGIIITIVSSATVIYEINHWTLAKQSAIHFFIMLITVFPCLLFSGWFPLRSVIDFLKVLGIFLLVGLILWTISFLIFGKLLNK